MEKIFVVVKSGGQYDDRYHENHVARITRSDAEQYITDQIARAERTYKEEQVLTQFATEYYSLNPRPASPERFDFPRWPSGMNQKDITVEMRTERDKIVKKNKKNLQHYSEQLAEHTAKMLEAQQAFAKEKGFSIPKYIVNYASEVRDNEDWNIEELEIK